MVRIAFVFLLGTSEVLTIFKLAGNDWVAQVASKLTLSGLLGHQEEDNNSSNSNKNSKLLCYYLGW